MPRFLSILGPFVVVVLIGLLAAMYLRLNVDSWATEFVNSKLSESFVGTQFTGRVQKAVFAEGSGFELRGLEFVDTISGRSMLTVDSAFIATPINIRDLVSLDVLPTSVDVRRAKLTITEGDIANGQLKRLIAALNKHKSDQDLVPIRVRDSKVRYLRKATGVTTHLSDVAVDIKPDVSTGSRIIHVDLQCSGNHVKDVQAKGSVDLDKRNWHAQFKSLTGVCNDEVFDLLPIELKVRGSKLSDVYGDWQLSGMAAGNFDADDMPKFRFNCKLNNMSLQNKLFPAVLQRCQARIAIDNHGLSVHRAQGELGNSRFDITYQQTGLISRIGWSCSGSFTDMTVDHRILSFFPGACKKFCHDFSPAGMFDMQFKLDGDGKKEINAQIKDMSFSYHGFPYRVDHCIGNVHWVGDKLNFQVEAIEQNQLLTFNGQVDNPGDLATYVFHFGTDGRLPIDEKLLNSLQNHPTMDRAFRDFRSVGRVSGHGTVKKLTPGADAVVQKEVRIQFHDCSVRHRSFEYPMRQVNGTVLITHDGFTFKEVTGFNSSGHAMCNGVWNNRDGLRLVFICNAVQFDNRLRNALTPYLQEVWDAIRPSGEIKLGRVFLDYLPETSGLDVRVEASLGDANSPHDSSASINPTWFPYRIDKLKGDIAIGGGVISMNNMLGKHGQTWVTCAGTGRYSNTDWFVKLQNLLAGSVVPDEDLLRALPTDLALAIRELDYQGQMNVSGEIAFSGTHEDNSIAVDGNYESAIQQVVFQSDEEPAAVVDWDLRLDMDQAEMQVGLPLRNIFGSLDLAGRYNGEFAQCRGDISLDSLTIYGIQVTNVKGPIWIDNKQTLAGKFANSKEDRPQSLKGTVFDGQIVFDGWVSHEDKYPFFLQSTVENSALEELAGEMAPQMKELSGDAYGFLRLRGNADELHTFAGNGNIHLRNAKIHQLPVILALLKILSIKEVTRTAFDTSNVDFTIKGDQIKLDRIELIGDAISLIGNGYLELMRYADINFYSVVGRNRLYIPIFSELYTAGSQRIMWINIGGPMDNLQTTRRVLPGLNDSIRALFQNNANTNNNLHSEPRFRRN